MKFTLPELKFKKDALAPHIDALTMEIHHEKHHAAYINNLNAALEGKPEYENWSIEKLLKQLDTISEDIRMAVRNNGGGHYNHQLFWESLTPDGKAPSDDFMKVINEAFGSFDALKNQLKDAGVKRFGSGWSWLVLDNGALKVVSTANQDAPISSGQVELLGIDVWEHAYYLNYQNRRPDYLEAIFNVIDWSVVEARYLAAK